MPCNYEVQEYYDEITGGCLRVSSHDEELIKETIHLTLMLHRDKLYRDAQQQASETPLFKY